jgi:hypothetical protein
MCHLCQAVVYCKPHYGYKPLAGQTSYCSKGWTVRIPDKTFSNYEADRTVASYAEGPGFTSELRNLLCSSWVILSPHSTAIATSSMVVSPMNKYGNNRGNKLLSFCRFKLSRMLCRVGWQIVNQHFGVHAASLIRKGLT